MIDVARSTFVGCVRNGFPERMALFSPIAIVVWLGLARRADEAGRCFPSIGRIMQDTGLARSSVCKGLRELLEAGEVGIVKGGGKGNRPNEYTLKGSSQFELVQDANQSKLRTEVVRDTDQGSPQIEHKLYPRTKPKKNTHKREGTRRFVPPSKEQVDAYCKGEGYEIDAEAFVAYYAQQGWKLSNGNAMKDWRFAIVNWVKRNKTNGNNGYHPAGDLGEPTRPRTRKFPDRHWKPRPANST
jgi:hypothetical protein